MKLDDFDRLIKCCYGFKTDDDIHEEGAGMIEYIYTYPDGVTISMNITISDPLEQCPVRAWLEMYSEPYYFDKLSADKDFGGDLESCLDSIIEYLEM